MNSTTSDWRLLSTVLGVVFVAQLPGKSALTALVLASRNRLAPVLAGACLALAAHSAIAVATGGLLSLLPARPVHIGAGLLFVTSAILMWRARPEEPESEGAFSQRRSAPFVRVFAIALTAVFVAEWGDLTQLATAALAARYGRPLPVFAGAVLGLWAATTVAILVGRGMGHLLRPRLTQRIAAGVFGALGLALLAGFL